MTVVLAMFIGPLVLSLWARLRGASAFDGAVVAFAIVGVVTWIAVGLWLLDGAPSSCR